MRLPIASAVRAWSTGGVGNGPTLPTSGDGDQYLEVDPKIWAVPHLPETLGPWLTLKVRRDEYNQVGNRLESWVSLPLGRWQFVGRMCPFNLDLHERVNYFAHGRGWMEEAWTNPDEDPGAWLGDASAFDDPWTVDAKATPRLPREPHQRSADWGAMLQTTKHAAASLLAHLYQAIVERGTVVCRAPIMEFTQGQPLGNLIGFARAALPFSIKRQAKIRAYADDPEFFIGEGVHLLAIMDTQEVAAENRPVTVLRYRDGRISGPAAGPRYKAYADAVVRRAQHHPEALLHFSGLAEQRLSDYLQGETGLAIAVPIVYNLSAAALNAGSWHDKLLRDKIYPESQQRDAPLHWSRLIDDDDFKRATKVTLEQLALSDGPTQDSLALRRLIRRYLDRVRHPLDGAIAAWWQPDAHHAAELVDLAAEDGVSHLVSMATLAAQLRTLPASVVAEMLGDTRRGSAFVKAVGDSPLPESWRAPELLHGTAAAVASRFHTIAFAPGIQEPWREWLDAWADRLARDSFVSSDLGEALCRVPPHASDVRAALDYGELYTRHQKAAERARPLMNEILKHVTSAADRQRIAADCVAGQSAFLTEHLPTTWLLESLGDTVSAGLFGLLDARIAAQTAAQTAELIEAGWWLRWALRASADAQAGSAASWLSAWSNRRTLEEWQHVADVLRGRVTGAQMAAARTRTGSPLPWIRGFEDEQFHDAAGMAADLSALCEVAETRTPAAYQQAEDANRESGSLLLDGLPAGALGALAREAWEITLNLAQARLVLDRAGDRRPAAVRLYCFEALRKIDRDEVSKDITARELWPDPVFRRAVAEWLSLNQHAIRSGPAQALDGCIKAGLHPPIPGQDLSGVAAYFRDSGYRRIAEFLRPGITEGIIYRTAAEALARGETGNEVWAQLSGLVATGTESEHPLRRLAASLARLDAETRTMLHESGYDAFLKILQAHPDLLDAIDSGPLPAFRVLFMTHADVTLYTAARALLETRLRGSSPLRPSWIGALEAGFFDARRIAGGLAAGDDPVRALSRFRTRAEISRLLPHQAKQLLLSNASPVTRRRQ